MKRETNIMNKTLVLKVVGEHTMHCVGCERSVIFALSQLPGVEQVKADWKKQIIQVDLYSETSNLEELKAELDWIGYEVDIV